MITFVFSPRQDTKKEFDRKWNTWASCKTRFFCTFKAGESGWESLYSFPKNHVRGVIFQELSKEEVSKLFGNICSICAEVSACSELKACQENPTPQVFSLSETSSSLYPTKRNMGSNLDESWPKWLPTRPDQTVKFNWYKCEHSGFAQKTTHKFMKSYSKLLLSKSVKKNWHFVFQWNFFFHILVQRYLRRNWKQVCWLKHEKNATKDWKLIFTCQISKPGGWTKLFSLWETQGKTPMLHQQLCVCVCACVCDGYSRTQCENGGTFSLVFRI